MAYAVGILFALLVAGAARLTRFDQGRSFYPTVLIVIATLYILFAVMAESRTALFADALFALFSRHLRCSARTALCGLSLRVSRYTVFSTLFTTLS